MLKFQQALIRLISIKENDMKIRVIWGSYHTRPRAYYQQVGLLAEVRLLKHKPIYVSQITYFRRRDNVVGIETRYVLDGLRFEPR